MSGDSPLYVGIDLGTTNSAVATFDGDACTLVRNPAGSDLTPSVVRIDARGNVTVGARARRYLESDPANTRTEFKRLMGTAGGLPFPASAGIKTPEALSAAILESLRTDVREATGVDAGLAVIGVPALFELPQNRATAEAARLAGFTRVELIQEPVASALAAGWHDSDASGSWLVYDLGGGTFDASLLETRDGLLRVVAHDGDNFPGGRDFDNAILDWLLAQLSRHHGVALERSDPEVASAARGLKVAVEDARIELTRGVRVPINPAHPFVVLGRELGVDVVLDRETVEGLCTPIVARSIAVCRRLVAASGLEPGRLQRVVLVGGPTVMPLVRRMVRDAFDAPIVEGVDPMTLVARGAALFAATLDLNARPAHRSAPARTGDVPVWVYAPAVSADLTPFVVGRLADAEVSRRPVAVHVRRSDGGWSSPEVPIESDGTFTLEVKLAPRSTNMFALEGRAADGSSVSMTPGTFSIIHGVTIGDPPLSRTIGVALADDSVRTFFERGVPLPTTRTFVQHTVSTVVPGGDGVVIKIPIVQGEFGAAHLCRPVGSLEIRGNEIQATLPAGSTVEVTLALDRAGQLTARAHVPQTGRTFGHVEHLVLPDTRPDALEGFLKGLRDRLAGLQVSAFARRDTNSIGRLGDVERSLAEAAGDLAAAKGGDEDASQKLRRTLSELDAMIGEEEAALNWPEFAAETRDSIAAAASWASSRGTDAERRLLHEAVAAVRSALETRSVESVNRRMRAVIQLGNAAYFRHPRAWAMLLERAAGEIARASDVAEAKRIVANGRAADNSGDVDGVRAAVQALWRLLPPDVEANSQTYDSGLR